MLDEMIRDDYVCVHNRLLAVLGDEQMATSVFEVVNLVLQRVDEAI
jgi:hypothetical protein